MKVIAFLLLALTRLFAAELRVQITIGENSPKSYEYSARMVGTSGAVLENVRGEQLESGDSVQGNLWKGRAGAGDADGISFLLSYSEDAVGARSAHVMWSDLIAHSDADTARRLDEDPAFRIDPPGFTVLFDEKSTRGFTVTAEQLRTQRAIWIPAFDAFVTIGGSHISLAQHKEALAPWRGKRILDALHDKPEATYDQYASLWDDMGNPAYVHPHQMPPGHVVCLSWDSAIPKFGIDRGSGVWNDYGNPDQFRFWFAFGDLSQGLARTWRSQSLQDGLPIIKTVLEDDGVRYEIEQFAYPLQGPPRERRGDIAMVLLQKLRVTNLGNTNRTVPIAMTHLRRLPAQIDTDLIREATADGALFRESARGKILLSVQGSGPVEWHETHDYQHEQRRLDITAFAALAPQATREFVVKLPSPVTDDAAATTLERLDYGTARDATVKFWSDWVERGAQFHVPEKSVNDLFRASLWHALRLPRRHGGEGRDVEIDLPYSNFAYDQTGVPWPGVQSIYVDYMTYELRGYNAVALEELLDEFRLNQDTNGHVGGLANWMMYTPSMLYSVAQFYLLTHDRDGLNQLLPYARKALDWCLSECRRAQARSGSDGLVQGPLNDGTGDGVWALNQAYMFAGLERFGTVLKLIRDPSADQVLAAAQALSKAVQEGFGRASALSPVVQLRDHTWQPYVPSEAHTPRRLMDLWYPTDVDVGPVHLLRLKALSSNGDLANFLLNDHEDNLYLRGLGMANEPVYMPQAIAYLIRDDPSAAVRTFYSQMACAFSQTVHEPVEHRWMHGQYFGPPSTDGAWFELYRNMLVRESDDQTLFIGQAPPRKWLEDGQTIDVSRAPTYFGPVSFQMQSHAASGSIVCHLNLAKTAPPKVLLVRLRHPQSKLIRSVTVNGHSWDAFDPAKEWVRIENPRPEPYEIITHY